MFQAGNKSVTLLDVLPAVCSAAFVFVFNPVNHFSVCLALSAKAGPQCFPLYLLSPLWCISPPLLAAFASASLHGAPAHTEFREGGKNIFCSSYWSLGLRLKLLLCLIWWNRVHIAQSRLLFEKDICLLLHIFIPLHSTVQIIFFGEISTFIGKIEILLLQQTLKDIILNHWIRAFF